MFKKSDIKGSPFCAASLFNFQNKLNEYQIKTGENILEQVFDNLTEQQLKRLKIKTNIQRSDSFLIGSNIRNYSRLQLLVEVLIRLHRILVEEKIEVKRSEQLHSGCLQSPDDVDATYRKKRKTKKVMK